jgi:hypothetical protein
VDLYKQFMDHLGQPEEECRSDDSDDNGKIRRKKRRLMEFEDSEGKSHQSLQYPRDQIQKYKEHIEELLLGDGIGNTLEDVLYCAMVMDLKRSGKSIWETVERALIRVAETHGLERLYKLLPSLGGLFAKEHEVAHWKVCGKKKQVETKTKIFFFEFHI